MTTALQIIDRAYSLIGFKAAGETLSSEDADYALDALNSMIDSWNTQEHFIVSVHFNKICLVVIVVTIIAGV